MSVCWVCRRIPLALLAALAFLSFGSGPAHARRVSETTIQHDDGTASKRIEINGKTMSVTVTHADSAGHRDSSSIDIGGEFDGAGIRVRGDGNNLVRLFSDVRVGPDERVDGDVVAVFGSVRVEGEVTGSAVAVFGSLDLRRGAMVRGDAVAVGGPLHQGEGAHVSGEAVQVGFSPLTLGLPGLPVVLATIVLGWLVSLFFGWIAAALFPGRLARIAITSSRRTAASLAIGVLSGPLVLMAGVLLLVTVIGIPVAILTPFVYVGVVYAGQLAATYVLGCKLTGRRLGEGSATMPLLSGSLLVASIFFLGSILWETPGLVRTVALFFMLVGLLLVVGLSLIGTGAFLLSRAGSRPRDIGADAPAAAPASAPGAPAVG
ncbi:MAG: polymer-forming cytoskeletal protein [Candidatus Eisenbacteria bacterium]